MITNAHHIVQFFKISRIDIIIFGILVAMIGTSRASNGAALTAGPIPEEQVNRLVEAAWKERIHRIDALVYKHILEPPKSEEEIRQKHEESSQKLWDVYETRSVVMEQEQRDRQVQKNVEWELQAQKAGRRVKQRIRIDGARLRVDQILILPEMVLLEGTPHEQRRPATEYGPDAPYEMTFLYRDSSEYRYNHMSRGLAIFARNKPPEIRDIQEFTCQTGILQGYLGTFTGSEDPLYVPDSEKIRRLAETGLLDNDRWLTITPDPNAPDRNVRIQIGQGEKPYTIMICDKEDYWRVYDLKTYFPMTGKLLISRQFSQFDQTGFPHHAVLTEYDLNGNLHEKEIYRIEEIHLNPDFAPEVFAADVPEGYHVNDLRDPEKFREEKKKAAEIKRAEQILLTHDMEKIKPLLSHPEAIIRIKALMTVEFLLKDNPKELREIAGSMQDDPRPEICNIASDIIKKSENNR